MADDLLNNVLGADYQEVNAVQSGNAVYKNGKLQYFKIDIDQPGKYFFDLTDAFNAAVDESNKVLPLQFVRGGQPIQLNGFTISMDGRYPDMTTDFHVAGKLNTSSPAFVNFALPLGMFQAVGPYRFQFTITNSNTGEVLKSPYQFFNVTESATNLAIDLNKGIEPYDSEYQNWKVKVEAEINSELTTLNNLSESADQLKALMNQYVSDAEGYVESQFTKCLQKENTWTNKQHFNGGITADSAEIANGASVGGSLSVSGDITAHSISADGTVALPSNTTINTDVLKYENGNLAQGLFPCEGYWFATTNGQCVSSSLINGVTGYISCKKFRYTPRNGDAEYALMEYHMNVNIPTSAFGKPIVQFSADFGGVDQTPFILGGHVLQLDAGAKVLKCNGYASGYNSTIAMDAAMV